MTKPVLKQEGGKRRRIQIYVYRNSIPGLYGDSLTNGQERSLNQL